MRGPLKSPARCFSVAAAAVVAAAVVAVVAATAAAEQDDKDKYDPKTRITTKAVSAHKDSIPPLRTAYYKKLKDLYCQFEPIPGAVRVAVDDLITSSGLFYAARCSNDTGISGGYYER